MLRLNFFTKLIKLKTKDIKNDWLTNNLND